MTANANAPWGAPPTAKQQEALDAAAAAARELASAEYAKKLVPMVHAAHEGYTGPLTADVHENEVDNWQQAGWTKA